MCKPQPHNHSPLTSDLRTEKSQSLRRETKELLKQQRSNSDTWWFTWCAGNRLISQHEPLNSVQWAQLLQSNVAGLIRTNIIKSWNLVVQRENRIMWSDKIRSYDPVLILDQTSSLCCSNHLNRIRMIPQRVGFKLDNKGKINQRRKL